MELIIIAIVAFFASMLTFFSGFGLGTILSPVMLLFFPVEIAIALTGVVHFLNNCFKITLVRKHINWSVGLLFGSTALIGSFIGALVLLRLSDYSGVVYSYTFQDKIYSVTLVKFIIAQLMLLFVLIELIPALKSIQFSKRSLPVGGLISGFFGGLSGNQGALRSMFLLKSGLNKEAYIATGILIAFAVDITRLSVYFNRMEGLDLNTFKMTLLVAILAAFSGAYLGRNLLKKVTLKFVQILVSILIGALAIGLGLGVL
jgi:uncharacterized membrane protein YfcA